MAAHLTGSGRRRKRMLSDLLKIWRWKNGLNVRAAAARFGISPATYSRIENGKKMDSKTMLTIMNKLFGGSNA
jgi:transcriptional regulator with XRE-family HTH domain